jgi:hypothetical protein
LRTGSQQARALLDDDLEGFVRIAVAVEKAAASLGASR